MRIEPERVARNRAVTAGYYELSKAMDAVINPPGTPNGGINWSTHAAWASNQAGQGIRGEGLPPVGTAKTPQALSIGNSKVYENIAPDLASFAQTFRHDAVFDQAKFDRWAERFDPSSERKKEGFQAYYEARFERDLDRKQELVLLGNVKIVGYEQDYLQPDIEQAMTASGTVGAVAELLGAEGVVRRLGTRMMTICFPDTRNHIAQVELD